MSEPEYESPVAGFEVWREDDGKWRGRHKESGRTINAEQWEMLVWRARETILFITITNVGEMLDQAVRSATEPDGER
ncbi:hypothetical protein [Nonomuraea glycinis]|uniref:hypothetical protein n=1 Tax=Nonomuraea glycinis TaxID=2047744 RepID=UPI002E126488|nr:hypothetical protein OHA68_41610 [Nonomuraea glycinis]